jgi:hypothetical protein
MCACGYKHLAPLERKNSLRSRLEAESIILNFAFVVFVIALKKMP